MLTSLRALLIVVLVAAGFAAAFATGADARSRHHHRHHRGDGFDLGDAIIGAAVLGAVIGIANSARKSRDERVGRPLPPAPYPDDRYPGDPYPDRDDPYDDPSADWEYADPDYAARFPSERQAIDACAREAEALGSRYGADARVARIDDVSRDGRDMRVMGTVRI